MLFILTRSRKAGCLCSLVTIAIVFFSSVFFPCRASPLSWQRLHEEADGMASGVAATAESSPSSIENIYRLALVYLNESRDDEAEKCSDTMLRLKPGIVEGRWIQAEVLRRRRSLEESQGIASELIKAEPGYIPPYITLAYIKYLELKFDEAAKLSHFVISRGRKEVDLSNYTRAYLLLAGSKGQLASRNGPVAKLINGTRVLPLLKKAESLQPDSPAVLFGLGSYYFLAPRLAGGDINKAEQYLRRAVNMNPRFADALVRLAQVYKAKGEHDKYREYLSRALSIDPQNELAADEESGVCRFNCTAIE